MSDDARQELEMDMLEKAKPSLSEKLNAISVAQNVITIGRGKWKYRIIMQRFYRYKGHIKRAFLITGGSPEMLKEMLANAMKKSKEDNDEE